MKKEVRFISLLAVGICAGILFCGFDTPPEVEENPNTPPVYTEESFEVSGRIPETAEQVPEFTVDIPVKVIDANGNPVQNAGIVITHTLYGKENFRELPSLNAGDMPILTDHEGKATIKYTGIYTETTLFVFTPEILMDCSGKYINSNEYPDCTRCDISLNTSGNMKETVITVNPSEKVSTVYSYTAVLRRNSKPVTDYLCTLWEVIPPKPSEPSGSNERHAGIGIVPPLYHRALTSENGKVSFPNLTEGTWEMSVYDSKNFHSENGTSNLVKTYTFTIDKKNPQKNAVILLPNQ
jgi:hypothetical protein